MSNGMGDGMGDGIIIDVSVIQEVARPTNRQPYTWDRVVYKPPNHASYAYEYRRVYRVDDNGLHISQIPTVLYNVWLDVYMLPNSSPKYHGHKWIRSFNGDSLHFYNNILIRRIITVTPSWRVVALDHDTSSMSQHLIWSWRILFKEDEERYGIDAESSEKEAG